MAELSIVALVICLVLLSVAGRSQKRPGIGREQ